MERVDCERLNRLLGGAELAWVVDRVRRRIELGQPMDGTIARRSATATERDAIARLLGRPPRAARGLSVSLDELDALLRRSGIHAGGLAAAVVTLTGPVTVRADRVADEQRAWAEVFSGIETACAGRDQLAAWLERVRASGVVKRLAGGSPAAGRGLLDVLASVVAALPTSGESLSAFAARITGRAHALDAGSRLGTLALGAARALSGLESPGPDESAAESRREAWAAVGVLCDELSSVVLTLALPGDASVTGRVLAAAGATREPVWLTLRQLVRSPSQWHGIDSAARGGEPVSCRRRRRYARRAVPADCLHQRSAGRSDDGAAALTRRRRGSAASPRRLRLGRAHDRQPPPPPVADRAVAV